ncbi:MAG TPA: PilZ domain-containing protein [Elusimicrobiota bacterium]|nr:PilZ domain-containing protein [Elusimicrobiota bacterium]
MAPDDTVSKNEKSDIERRQTSRIGCRLPVRYKEKGQGLLVNIKTAQSGNLSANGIFLTFGEKIAVGMLMELEIPVPGLLAPISALAKVVWRGGTTSCVECGLEFTEIKPQDRVFLMKFILDQKKISSGKSDKPGGT